MKVSGLMTWLMARGSIFIVMELSMKVNGSMTSSMVMELRYGQMELDTKVCSKMARRKARVS